MDKKLTRRASQAKYRDAVYKAYRRFNRALSKPIARLVSESVRLCGQANFHHVIGPAWNAYRDVVREAKQAFFRAVRMARYDFMAEQDCAPQPVMDQFVR